MAGDSDVRPHGYLPVLAQQVSFVRSVGDVG